MEALRGHFLCSYTYAELRSSHLDVNDGHEVHWDEADRPLSWFYTRHCKYCNQLAIEVSCDDQPVFVCSNCGWWFFGGRWTDPVIAVQHQVWGKAKEYDIGAIDVPLETLRRYLQRHPDHMAHLHYTRFEQLMADCLRSAYPDCTVQHIGKTGDGGVDILVASAQGESYLVQVKKRGLTTGNEGVRAVRELNGVLFREGKARGMLITTAPGFTVAAQHETKVLTVTPAPYKMILLSFPDIMQLLQLPSPEPYEPWRQFVKMGVKLGLTTRRT